MSISQTIWRKIDYGVGVIDYAFFSNLLLMLFFNVLEAVTGYRFCVTGYRFENYVFILFGLCNFCLNPLVIVV